MASYNAHKAGYAKIPSCWLPHDASYKEVHYVAKFHSWRSFQDIRDKLENL